MDKARVYESRFLNGDMRGYQAECEACDWRGPVHSSMQFAYDDRDNHKHVSRPEAADVMYCHNCQRRHAIDGDSCY